MSEPAWELVLRGDGRYAVYRDGVFKGYTLDSYSVNFNKFMCNDDDETAKEEEQ